jgi:class 3 adenylate cyclase
MSLKEKLQEYANNTFSEKWDTRKGQKVPETDDIKLGNEAVLLDATVLYADLDESTSLVDNHKPWFAAEIYKTFLYCSAKIIRKFGGIITSFDGDRIMAIYIGSSKNTSAAKTALKINYAVKKIINPAISANYNSNYKVRQVVGIDSSELYVARTGIRGSNDLVWVGKAANYAAKLSNLSSDYPTRLTEPVYKKLNKVAKFGKLGKGKNMWQKATWKSMNNLTIYRSSWHWKFK